MKDVQVKRVEVGIMPTNCYIIKPGESRDAIVIDPGDELTVIQDALHRMDAVCRLILLTHGHFDHILAVGDLRGSKVPVAIHERDAEMLTERDMFSSMIKYDPRPFEPAEFTFKKEGSYTSYLFEKGIDKILKKVGEECAETIIAAKNGDKAELVGEINDVFYHMMVMMNECGVTMEDVCKEMDIRAQKIGNLKKFHVSDHNT